MRPKLVIADGDGNIYDHPELEMTGKSGTKLTAPDDVEIIPLPERSTFFTMPGRIPVGWDPKKRRYEPVEEIVGQPCSPVAAFLPPGYTRTLLPGAIPVDKRVTLPLWAYTAVGWMDDQFWVAATKVDEFDRWNPEFYEDDELIGRRIAERLKEHPENRLLNQLARCATEYRCFNAINVFLSRWECGIPVSPTCNARCAGCLSLQPAQCCPSSQERINFVPTIDEVIEIAVPHLETAEGAIVSFGQGCEGEPLLQADLLIRAIEGIRSQTDKGTINMNTNGSLPEKVRDLCRAGLDCIRISLNSARPVFYERYYRPKGYSFDDVVESMCIAKAHGLLVSINLLVYPGFTDEGEELQAMMNLIGRVNPDQIQMRNLNIDPELYLRRINFRGGPGIGITRFMKAIRDEFPHVRFGYFNKPKEMFS